MSAKLEPLNEAERRLVTGAAQGGWIDVTGREAAHLSDASTYTETIRAEVLVALLRGEQRPWSLHHKGLKLRRCRISGVLDLEDLTLSHPIWFEQCWFDEAPLLRDAVLTTFSMARCISPGLRAERVRLDKNLFLRGTRFTGPVELAAARIQGQWAAEEAKFDKGVSAVEIQVSGGVGWRGVAAAGAIQLISARFGGWIDLTATRFIDVILNRAHLSGGLFMADAQITGRLGLARVAVGADADLSKTDLHRLCARRMEVIGDLKLSEAVVRGPCELEAAAVDGDVVLSGAELMDGLAAPRLSVDGIFDFRPRTVAGPIILEDAELRIFEDRIDAWPEQEVNLQGLRCRRFGPQALAADEARVTWIEAGRGLTKGDRAHLADRLRHSGADKIADRIVPAPVTDAPQISAPPRRRLKPLIGRILRGIDADGTRPARPFAAGLILWLCTSALLFVAERLDWLGTSHFDHAMMQEMRWSTSSTAVEPMPGVDAFTTAIDVLVPGLDLGLESLLAPGPVLGVMLVALKLLAWVVALCMGGTCVRMLRRIRIKLV